MQYTKLPKIVRLASKDYTDYLVLSLASVKPSSISRGSICTLQVASLADQVKHEETGAPEPPGARHS